MNAIHNTIYSKLGAFYRLESNKHIRLKTNKKNSICNTCRQK